MRIGSVHLFTPLVLGRRRIVAIALGLLAAGFLVSFKNVSLSAESATMTVTITRVVELNCDEGAGESCPNDYYPKVDIAAGGLDDGKDRYCCAHGTDFEPNWVFSRAIDTSQPAIPVHIELFDQDDLSADDLLDISSGGSPLDITVNLNTCTWQQGTDGVKGTLNTQGSSQGSGDDSAKIYFVVSVDKTDCADSDGDGLLDKWEINGYDANGDGVIDVNLPAMGANPKRRDLFLELDYLVAGTHTHAPLQAAIQQVVQAFANAPVLNPDSTYGIQLHVDVGNIYGAGTVVNVPRNLPPAPSNPPYTPATGTFGDYGGGNGIAEAGNLVVDYDGAAGNPATNFFNLKNAPGNNFNALRDNIFRYVIFVHQTNFRAPANDCTSGWAKGIPGTNFLVALGGTGATGNTCWGVDGTGNSVGSQAQQAGTLMHEFGHVLGLHHGGGDDTNNKPNYLSIMSYRLLRPGVNISEQSCGVPAIAAGLIPGGIPGGCDYSRISLPPLVENSLDECAGFDGRTFLLGPIDWNGNGRLEGAFVNNFPNCQPPLNFNVTANVNLDTSNDIDGDGLQGPGEPPIISQLNGFDDWKSLVYNFRTVYDFTTAGEPTRDEPDPEAIERAHAASTALTRPALSVALAAPADARPGDTLTYSMTLDNPLSRTGRGPALNVALIDTKPDLTAETMSIGVVALESTVTRDVRYPVACSTRDGSTLTDVARADGVDLAGNNITATSSATTTIHAPVLTLSLAATPSVNAGEAIGYTLTYENTGSGAATDVVLRLTLSAGLYYSIALDQGAGPRPATVNANADGTTTLEWSIGGVAAASGPRTVGVTARPTLLALGGTIYTATASLAFQNGTGCVFDALQAAAPTSITVVAASGDPESLGFWRNHPELEGAELLARIQATDQRYDGSDGSTPDGALSASEVRAALLPGGNMPYVLEEQLLATYFNLASRRQNAGTQIVSKVALALGLLNVRDAALFAIDTLRLPVSSATRPRYSDATTVLDDVNHQRPPR